MTAEQIAALFTGPDGAYHFARWRRPLAPVVFGVQDSTLALVKGALATVAALTGQPLSEVDPELGANLMIFFLRDWRELAGVPDLEHLVPGLTTRAAVLTKLDADHYRQFRYEADGAIRAAFVFVRMSDRLTARPADDLALDLALRAILPFQTTARRDGPWVVRGADGAAIAPFVADLVRVAYDPVLPVAATDKSHALRLAARLSAT
jgi:hypothetical protein